MKSDPSSIGGIPCVRVLTVGYTSLAQATAKGIISDHPDAFNLWYNPGGRLARSVVYIPFGKQNLDLNLTEQIRYIERAPASAGTRPLRRVRQGLHCFKALFQGIRLIRTERIDVLKANGPNLSAAVVVPLRWLCRKPSVMFIEAFWEPLLQDQLYMPRWLRATLPMWYRFTYRVFDFYFGTPSIDPGYFTARGMNPKRILPWMNELDLEFLAEAASHVDVPSAVHRLPHPRIVTVGRLHPEKHAIDALLVLDGLKKRGQSASLILVGDGEERASLEQEAARRGLRDHVFITGTVSQAAGFAIVRHADLYFAPMQGNALVEALFSGLPVVAYDHATHRNLIRDGETGWLVPDRDVDAAVATLERLLRDPGHAARISSAGAADMESRFGRAVVAEVLSRPVFAAYAQTHSSD